jgi:hypothetical protein
MNEADEAVTDAREEEAALPGVSFWELRQGVCKFPLGRFSDPPERFCGEPAAIGSPYCPQCRRIVYALSTRRWQEF